MACVYKLLGQKDVVLMDVLVEEGLQGNAVLPVVEVHLGNAQHAVVYLEEILVTVLEDRVQRGVVDQNKVLEEWVCCEDI